MFSSDGIKEVANYVKSLGEEEKRDIIEKKLKVGLHSNVQVTHYLEEDEQEPNPFFVSQIFCSALPCSYCFGAPRACFEDLAKLVLTGAYKTTLGCALANPKSNVVFLTALGGGVFGNEDEWIEESIRNALEEFKGYELDVRIVSYGRAEKWIRDLVEEYQ